MKGYKRFFASIVVAVMVLCMMVQNAQVIYGRDFKQEPKDGTVVVAFYASGITLRYFNPKTNKYYGTNNVVTTQSLGSGVISSGSGWFVGEDGLNPQYLVTNNHVIDDFVSSKEGGSGKLYTGETKVLNNITYYLEYSWSKCEIRVYYDENDFENAYIVDHGDTDKVDLAVLRLEKPTDKRVALKLYEPSKDKMQGEHVMAVGFPGNAENQFTAAHKWGKDDVKYTEGIISKFGTAANGVERIDTDAVIQHGNSGGPFVDEKGYVIGVSTNVSSRSPYAGQVEADYYAITAKHVIEMLKKNNVTYVDAMEYEEALKKKAVGGVIGTIIAIVAVVAVLAIVAVVLVKNGKLGAPKKAAEKPVEKKITGYDPKTGAPIYEEEKPVEKKITGYDPKTGAPIYEEEKPVEKKIIGYDPKTGAPIYEEEKSVEKKIIGYDPKTGVPIYEEEKPVEKKITGYDPKTGAPIYEEEKPAEEEPVEEKPVEKKITGYDPKTGEPIYED